MKVKNKDQYLFDCPACECAHYFSITGTKPVWNFNGDFQNPTVSPSIEVNYPDGRICHFSIRHGKIYYENDSTHDFKGRTLELPEL